MSFTTADMKECACIACGRGSDHCDLRRLHPGGASYVCASCEIKWGRKRLRAEYDRQLGKAIGGNPTLRQCVRGCGRPVFIRPSGELPSFCSACVEEWMQLSRAAYSDKRSRKRKGKMTQLDIVDETKRMIENKGT